MKFQPVVWLKNLFASQWMSNLLKALNKVVLALVEGLGKEMLEFLKVQILYAAGQDWDNEVKFAHVLSSFKAKFVTKEVRDSAIRLAIELLYNDLKDNELV